MSLAPDLAELLGLPPPPVIWLRRPAVEQRTGLSRSEIYRRMSDNTFPRPRTISVRKVVWNLAEVDDWMRSIEAAA
jgi:prophage regulatory protein